MSVPVTNAPITQSEPLPIDGLRSTVTAVQVEDPPELPETVIRARSGWRGIDWRELWQFRELIYCLAVRDIQVRYKQTLIGALWTILQPLMMAGLFTVVMNRMAGVSTGTIPYPLFAFCGFLLWTYFSRGITAASGSVIHSQSLITKVYFPRLAIPFAAVGAGLVDLSVSFPVLLAMMWYYGFSVGWGLLLTPIFVLLVTLLALGVGTLLAALSVAYRDFKHVLPFIVQVWMFATPAIYMDTQRPAASEPVPAVASDDRVQVVATPRSALKLSRWMEWNPLMGLVNSFRAAMLGNPLPWSAWAYSAVASGIAFMVGSMYFRRVERRFADII